MRAVWPDGFERIPDEDWVAAPVETLALNYDTVEDHGWYRNLDRTIDDLARFVEPGTVLVDYSGGTGILAVRMLEEIEERDFGILIVDSSPKFLRLAVEKLGRHERVAFRLIRYLKDERRLQLVREVVPPSLLERGVDGVVSTNAVHLYYDLESTLRSWFDLLRPGGRAFVQSGNIGIPYMPAGSWIIDETVEAIAQHATAIVREDPAYRAERSWIEDEARMKAYADLRHKYFLPVRPIDFYLESLESTGFHIREVTHLPIEAYQDQWYEFLSTYHEGVLGWFGGVRRIDGEDPSPELVDRRLALIREAMTRTFGDDPSFRALWTYIRAARPG